MDFQPYPTPSMSSHHADCSQQVDLGMAKPILTGFQLAPICFLNVRCLCRRPKFLCDWANSATDLHRSHWRLAYLCV